MGERELREEKRDTGETTHAILVTFVERVDVVCVSTILVVLSGNLEEFFARLGVEAAIRDLQRAGVSVRRSSWSDLVRLTLQVPV